MNTNNRGLSTMANGQLERMIDDAAWITYPLHLVVGLIKTFVYTFLFIGLLIFMFFLWMFTEWWLRQFKKWCPGRNVAGTQLVADMGGQCGVAIDQALSRYVSR
jgi:hypothetical protein